MDAAKQQVREDRDCNNTLPHNCSKKKSAPDLDDLIFVLTYSRMLLAGNLSGVSSGDTQTRLLGAHVAHRISPLVFATLAFQRPAGTNMGKS